METKIVIMSVFCEYPERKFQIREIAKMVNINHTTVRQYLNRLKREGLLLNIKNGIYPAFKADINRKFLNFKLYYNLEKIRNAGLIELLEKEYDYPTIILFGSYGQARDISNSDVDICLLTEVRDEIDLTTTEKRINRKISLHIFDKKGWKSAKKSNPGLVNNICNGVVLSGKLEVV